MKDVKRFLSIALALLLVVGFLPVESMASRGKEASLDFVFYHKSKEKASMANDAFKKGSLVKQGDNLIFRFNTQPMEHLGKKANVTGITLIGKSGGQYEARGDKYVDPIVSPSTGPGDQVATEYTLSVPESEVTLTGRDDYEYEFAVQFHTNLRDAFSPAIAWMFPEAMVNPQARLFYNK